MGSNNNCSIPFLLGSKFNLHQWLIFTHENRLGYQKFFQIWGSPQIKTTEPYYNIFNPLKATGSSRFARNSNPLFGTEVNSDQSKTPLVWQQDSCGKWVAYQQADQGKWILYHFFIEKNYFIFTVAEKLGSTAGFYLYVPTKVASNGQVIAANVTIAMQNSDEKYGNYLGSGTITYTRM